MKPIRLSYIITFLPAVFVLLSCGDDDEGDDFIGNWIELSEFEGIRRSSAVSFVIGEVAYVGAGFNGVEDEYYQDFWRYNVGQNFWQRVDSFPGVGRSAAVAFSIGGKAYVGLGFDGDDELKDFYAYDASTDSWSQIADFGGSARRNSVAFSLNGKGYVGTGDDGNTLKDFWEYDPENDSWLQIPSLGGSKRENAVAFVLDDFAYVGTGSDNGVLELDFWRFDQTLLPDFPWTQMEDLDEEDDYEVIRENATAFTMNGFAYIVSGVRGSVTSSVWEYNPRSDFWTEKTPLEGAARTDAVAFSVNERGFISTGRTGSSYFDDIWEFKPFDEEDEED
ncbi:galactose oxidase [Fulvivirga sp. M361]|uniref:Kelch repeat-containing protein n=1 Tax=Fulvivirga sp. M361 TaxID=2594266 RepID=UPI00117BBAD4|nr:galactose oxidase [Fulvivirga sp. M361]TRX59113.1 galactose oxidase [Fulvivirga sp. M361]